MKNDFKNLFFKRFQFLSKKQTEYIFNFALDYLIETKVLIIYQGNLYHEKISIKKRSNEFFKVETLNDMDCLLAIEKMILDQLKSFTQRRNEFANLKYRVRYSKEHCCLGNMKFQKFFDAAILSLKNQKKIYFFKSSTNSRQIIQMI